MDSTLVVEELKYKIDKLIALYEKELEINAQHQLTIGSMEQIIKEKEKKEKELAQRIAKLQLTQAFKTGTSDAKVAKDRINKIVREIDKCIAMLNQ